MGRGSRASGAQQMGLHAEYAAARVVCGGAPPVTPAQATAGVSRAALM